jgi:hypothetical protein
VRACTLTFKHLEEEKAVVFGTPMGRHMDEILLLRQRIGYNTLWRLRLSAAWLLAPRPPRVAGASRLRRDARDENGRHR